MSSAAFDSPRTLIPGDTGPQFFRYDNGLHRLSLVCVEAFMKKEAIKRMGGWTMRQSIWAIEAAMSEKSEKLYAALDQLFAEKGLQISPPSFDLTQIVDSAMMGDGYSNYLMGDFHRTGEYGFPRDLTMAVHYYHRSAIAGYVDGIYNLALIYDMCDAGDEVWKESVLNTTERRIEAEGRINLQNPGSTDPEVWLKKAALLGVADAAYKLGWTFKDRNTKGNPEDGGIFWYTKAALAGHPYAQYNLGLCYKNGTGVERDLTEAVKWIRLAAEQNDPDAQHSLGLRYKAGEGVNQDYKVALFWLTKAADQGYGYSQYHLGSMYKKGLGTELDLYKSFCYFKEAANQGDRDAIEKLKKFNQEPVLSELLKSLWPLSHHLLNTKCQEGINEFLLTHKRYLAPIVPSEVRSIIIQYIVSYWPKSDPHDPYFISTDLIVSEE